VKDLLRDTRTPGVLSELGSFGGLFEPDLSAAASPVLVSSCDGVGTKLRVAFQADVHDTVGRDLVNHCVNDILVQGAAPLFFLDYFATGALDPDAAAAIIEGFAVACRENGCALIGGETAEMPDVYKDDDFDLAGCIVGVVDRSAIIDGRSIAVGDRIYALPSNGLHTNGYSLVRRIVFDKLGLAAGDVADEFEGTVADELLRVHRSYLAPVQRLRQEAAIKGLAHITGGGVLENLPRVLPASCDAVIHRDSWEVPAVFTFLQKHGEVEEQEMFRVFNMGLGMLIVVSNEDAVAAGRLEDQLGLIEVGEIKAGAGRVQLA